jgi:hypothetical protein
MNLLSICIPVVKTQFFKESLESACQFNGVNIIVLNNAVGSEKKEIRKIIEKTVGYDRIMYRENEDQIPMIENWNRLLGFAETTYVTILCDDDVLGENFMVNTFEKIHEYPNVSLFTVRYEIINETDLVERLGSTAPECENPWDFMTCRILGKRETFLSGIVFRRDDWLECGGFTFLPDGWGSDDLMWFKLAFKGNGVVFNPNLDVGYRNSSISVTNNNRFGNKIKAVYLLRDEVNRLISTYSDTADGFFQTVKKVPKQLLYHRLYPLVWTKLNLSYLLPKWLSKIISKIYVKLVTLF